MKTDIDLFYSEEYARVINLYGTKHKPGFASNTLLAEWYLSRLKAQECKCYYCETSIFVIKALIDDQKIRPRKIGYGFRGPILEIDKKENNLGYSKDNCVLSCYYCNNDKSYSVNDLVYKKYFGNARNHTLKTYQKKYNLLEPAY